MGGKLILLCFVFFALAKKLGITDVPAEVVTFISHATQNRLRAVLEKVTVITQHRMESYKVSVPWAQARSASCTQLPWAAGVLHLPASPSSLWGSLGLEFFLFWHGARAELFLLMGCD